MLRCLLFRWIKLLSTLQHGPFQVSFLLAPLHPNLQVAIIAGNFDLAEIIKVHKTSDVGKSTEVYHQTTSVF